METRNMGGLKSDEIEEAMKRQERGCLVAAVCIVALAVIGIGWLVYLACVRWPFIARALLTHGESVLFAAVIAVAATAVVGSIEIVEG